MHRGLDQSPVVIRAHMPSKASCCPSALQPCREWGGMLLFYRDSALHNSGPEWQSQGESLHLSLKTQFVTDTWWHVWDQWVRVPDIFWFPHQSPAHPASSRRVARIIQMHLMFPPQGKSNRECRGQAVFLRLSWPSALGWGTGHPFDSRDSKSRGDQGTVPRAGAGIHRAAWLQTDGKDRMDIGGAKYI